MVVLPLLLYAALHLVGRFFPTLVVGYRPVVLLSLARHGIVCRGNRPRHRRRFDCILPRGLGRFGFPFLSSSTP